MTWRHILPHSISIQVSNWLTKEVVYTENFEERVALASRMIDILAVSAMLCLNYFLVLTYQLCII